MALRAECRLYNEHQLKPGDNGKNKKNPPTLYEWAGGMKVFEELIAKFYDKVLEDELLKPIFEHMSEEHRKRWMNLLIKTADELELPNDPEFRSAFVAYLEWGTRLAVINSNLGEVDMSHDEPMPEWGWGVPGGPYQAD